MATDSVLVTRLRNACGNVGTRATDRLAAAAAVRIVVPDDWGCCGFVGDRGMLHPELTEAATRPERASVAAAGSQAHASRGRS